MSRRTIVVYVEDKPGVLNRVASLFRRRNFNIDSLNVGGTHKPGVSRMTIVCEADADKAKRVEANLYKLVNVLWVDDITERSHIHRVLALIKVNVQPAQRDEVLQICEVFRGRSVDMSLDSLTIEMTGTQDKIQRLAAVLEPFGIQEMVQTGTVAMTRGSATATPQTQTQTQTQTQKASADPSGAPIPRG